MKLTYRSLASLLFVGACTSVPSGPSVMALPGTGKNFEQFRSDDVLCRQFALNQTGNASTDQVATDAGLRSAAVGTAVGAVAGAVIGGRDAAGVGAGTGLLVGSMAGVGAAQSSAHGTQRQYDNAYVQCMYAKGERVPVSGALAPSRSAASAISPTPAGASLPPPPPGYSPR